MSLSIVLIFLSALFLIPTFFLTRNKLTFFTFCAFPPALLFISLFTLNFFFPSIGIEQSMGKAFLGFFSLFVKRDTLTMEEQIHVSFYLSLILMYFILYLIGYILLKIFFIGKNPDIHKAYLRSWTILLRVVFFLSSYGILFLTAVEIREILPLADGFLGFLFDFIHPIGA